MSKKYRVVLNGKKRSELKRLVSTGTDKTRKLKATGHYAHLLHNRIGSIYD